jgi:hypothetical protein
MYDGLVCVETVSREHRHTGSEAQVYIEAFTALQKVALTGGDARHFLQRIADDLT